MTIQRRPAADRSRLRRATLSEGDFTRYEALLVEARRLFAAMEAYRLSPKKQASPGRRLALRDELASLLAALVEARSELGEKLHRGVRAAGALRAYARGMAAGQKS